MSNRRVTLERDGERIELAQGESLVGRGHSCAVVLADPSVSRNHALVTVAGDHMTVTDLDSANGTYVNGERVMSERLLDPGDQILFGETEFEFRVEEVQSVSLQLPERQPEPEFDSGIEFDGDGTVSPIDPRLFFCSECGADLDGQSKRCGECGHALGGPPLSRSEVISLGEVMPVGEFLANPSQDLLETGPRPNLIKLENRDPSRDELDGEAHPSLLDRGESALGLAGGVILPEPAAEERGMHGKPSLEFEEGVESLELDEGVLSLDEDLLRDPIESALGHVGAADEIDEAENADETNAVLVDGQESESSEVDSGASDDSESGGREIDWLDESAADLLAAPLDAYPPADAQSVSDLLAVPPSDEVPGSQSVSDLLGTPPARESSVTEVTGDETEPVSEPLLTVEETLPVGDRQTNSGPSGRPTRSARPPLNVPGNLPLDLPLEGRSTPRHQHRSPSGSQVVDPYRVIVRSTPPGGVWRRLAAWLVDGVLIFGLGTVASLAVGGPTEPIGIQFGSTVAAILGLLVPLVGWAGPGTTPGKRLFDLWVCNPEEEAGIGLGRALVRLLGYGLGAALLGIGFLIIPFNASKRGLHDFLAGTRVIVGRP